MKERGAPECELSCPCRTAKHEPLLYGPQDVGGPAQESLGDLVAQFDKMAAERRAEAKQRAEGPAPVGTASGITPKSSAVVAVAAGAVPTTQATERVCATAQRTVRPRPQCAENVGTGTKIHQCTYTAKPGTLYCGRHQRQERSEDFESSPLIADRPDNFTW